MPGTAVLKPWLRATTPTASCAAANAQTVYDVNGNYYYPVLGEPNSRRLPDFFQLDVRIDKKFIFDSWMLALYLDVQNVTNNLNVEGVLNNFDYSQEAFLQSLPILPVFGVRGEW